MRPKSDRRRQPLSSGSRRPASAEISVLEKEVPQSASVISVTFLVETPCIRTTNGLERLNQEIKRRTRVIRIFPNRDACLRLVSALCVEQSEEWVSGKRYLNMEDLADFNTAADRKECDLTAVR